MSATWCLQNKSSPNDEYKRNEAHAVDHPQYLSNLLSLFAMESLLWLKFKFRFFFSRDFNRTQCGVGNLHFFSSFCRKKFECTSDQNQNILELTSNVMWPSSVRKGVKHRSNLVWWLLLSGFRWQICCINNESTMFITREMTSIYRSHDEILRKYVPLKWMPWHFG